MTWGWTINPMYLTTNNIDLESTSIYSNFKWIFCLKSILLNYLRLIRSLVYQLSVYSRILNWSMLLIRTNNRTETSHERKYNALMFSKTVTITFIFSYISFIKNLSWYWFLITLSRPIMSTFTVSNGVIVGVCMTPWWRMHEKSIILHGGLSCSIYSASAHHLFMILFIHPTSSYTYTNFPTWRAQLLPQWHSHSH